MPKSSFVSGIIVKECSDMKGYLGGTFEKQKMQIYVVWWPTTGPMLPCSSMFIQKEQNNEGGIQGHLEHDAHMLCKDLKDN